MRLALGAVLLAAAALVVVLGRAGDPKAPAAIDPPRPTARNEDRVGADAPGEAPSPGRSPSAAPANRREAPAPAAHAADDRPGEVSLEWLAPVADAIAEGRWADLEEARASVTDAGPGEALRLIAAGGRLTSPREALALALAVEDFLEGLHRDERVAREAARTFPELLRQAYDESGLEALRPLALRVLGHLPDPRTEAFLLDRLSGRPGPELEALLVDALGRAGGAEAAGALAVRFETSEVLDERRVALLALSRIRDRTGDPAVAEVVDRSVGDLVEHAATSPGPFEDEEWFYVTLGLVDGTSPAGAIAERVLVAGASPAARDAALAFLDRAGRPEDAPALLAAADRIADRDLARRTRELAARLAELPSTERGDGR